MFEKMRVGPADGQGFPRIFESEKAMAGAPSESEAFPGSHAGQRNSFLPLEMLCRNPPLGPICHFERSEKSYFT